MRGHGTVDVRHACECLIDRMARQLDLDPFAVRRANLLTAPGFTANGLMVNSYGLGECLDRVEQASGWRHRKGALPPGAGSEWPARTMSAARPSPCTGPANPTRWWRCGSTSTAP
jgi:hypothetical protein